MRFNSQKKIPLIRQQECGPALRVLRDPLRGAWPCLWGLGPLLGPNVGQGFCCSCHPFMLLPQAGHQVGRGFL